MSIQRDTVLNIAGQALPLALTLLTLPPYLALIGDARYGVLALAWVLLGYFGLFDFGLSRATAQRVAQLGAVAADCYTRLLWTALLTVTLFGFAAAPLLWTVGLLLFSLPRLAGGGAQPELAAALPYLVAGLPVALVMSVLSGALQGRRRFLALNLVSSSAASLALVLPLLVAAHGHATLDWLVPATLLPRLFAVVLLFRLCGLAWPRASGAGPDWRELRRLLQYGGWVSVTGVVGPLLAVADRVLIGLHGGAGAVTQYAVPQGLVARGLLVAEGLAAAVFPRFAGADPHDRHRLMSHAMLALALVMTPLVCLSLWLVGPFFRVWLGETAALPMIPVAQILLVGLWLNALGQIPLARLQGQGNPRSVALLHLAELVPYALVLTWLLWSWGVVGAAFAWTLRVGIDTVVLLKLNGDSLRFLRLFLLPAGVVLGTLVLLSLPVTGLARQSAGCLSAALLLAWMIAAARTLTARGRDTGNA